MTKSITEAARREAAARFVNAGSLVSLMCAAFTDGAEFGAEWAMSSEHTEEEVEALVDDIIHWDDTTATDGPCDGTWESLAAHLTRRGWTRTTRRDEEKTR